MKTFKLFLAALVLSGCSPFYLNTEGYSVKDGDLEESWKKTASYTYIWEELDAEQYIKSPHEFEDDGGGDCEDFAVYLMYLLGKKSELAGVLLNGTTLFHALVIYNGKYLDPQVYGKYYTKDEFILIKTYNYDYMMFAATNGGTKNIW